MYIFHFKFNYQISLYYLLQTKYTYVHTFLFTIKSTYIKIYTFRLLMFHSNKQDLYFSIHIFQ